jgi:hypothetical protein
MLRGLALVALLAIAVLAPVLRTREAPPQTDPRVTRLNDLDRRRAALLNRWSATLERTAVVQRVTELTGADSGLQIWLHGFPAHPKADRVKRLATEMLRPVGPVQPGVRIGVLVYDVAEYGSRSMWATYSGAWIGDAGGKTWCVAIIPGIVAKQDELTAHLGSSLSPCLLYAAFGKPGAPVAAWLEQIRYAPVETSSWLTRPKGWRDGYDQPPWLSLYDPSWFDAVIRARASRLAELGLGDLMTTLAPPYQLGTLALRCLAGNPDFCRRAVLDTTDSNGLRTGLPSDLTVTRQWLVRGTGMALSPRPLAGWYVSDLVRDQGRERFGSFWRSDRPLDEAFRTAFGEELGEWTERWARLHWEESNERFFGSRRIVLGATLAPSWPLVVAFWTLLALGLAASAARRRQAE